MGPDLDSKEKIDLVSDITVEDDSVQIADSDQALSVLSGPISERWQILSEIGRGGMSTVYKARHRVTGQIAAIKKLSADAGTKEKWLKRFEAEAMAIGNLDHAHIIKAHDFDTGLAGEFFIVMDYANGECLAEEIKRQGKLPAGRAIKLFQQVADALSHAHKRGIIHRDLKPSNVILVADQDHPDYVKIVDFGIAKLTGDIESRTQAQKLTATGETLGSPLYMSPEQFQGVTLDERSDIYSFGCLMYETLTGAPPFVGESAMNTMYMHLTSNPQPFVPPDSQDVLLKRLEQIAVKCLAKDRSARYSSMSELISDIEKAPGTEPLMAQRRTRVPRKPQAFVAIACVLFTIVLAAYSAFNYLSWLGQIQSSPSGSSQDWSKLDLEGQRALDRGHYEQADKLFQKALALAKSAPGSYQSDLETATYEELADLAYATGDSAQHNECMSKLKELIEKERKREDNADQLLFDQYRSVLKGGVVDPSKREDLAAKMNDQISTYIEGEQYNRAKKLVTMVESMYHKNEVSSERARALLFDSDIIHYIGEKPAPGEDGERVWKDDTRQALITSALQAYPGKPPLAPFLIEATMKLAQTEAHPDSEEKAQSTLAKVMKMLSQTDALVDPHLVDTYAEIQAYLPHTGSETEKKQYRADASLILSKSVKSADYNRIFKEQLAVHDDPAHSLAEYESDNLNSAHRVRNSMKIVSLLHRIGNGIPGLDGSPASQRAQVMQKRVWQEVRWLDL